MENEELEITGQVWHPVEEKTAKHRKKYLELKGRLEEAENLGLSLSEHIKARGGLEILLSIPKN